MDKVILVAVGAVVLLAAWVPAYLNKRPLSLPIVLVGASTAIFALVPGMPSVDPREHLEVTEHVTELGVLVALLGAGLSLDRRPGLRSWMSTWRLLSVAMPLTIAGAAILAWSLWGVAPAAALLFGAVIAPTDPVLAADVQVGEPAVDGATDVEEEDEVRFALTSEAGLNDGLAFPFVYAAVAAAAAGGSSGWIGHWALSDLVARVVIGVVVGLLVGFLLSRIMFDPPAGLTALADSTQGFVALGAILFAYGVAELSHGYGFLAVFVTAVTLRQSKREHRYHSVLHHFAGEIEQLLSVTLLILFGAAIASGLLADLTWAGAAVGVLVIFLVRPTTARLSMTRSGVSGGERRAIAFFGIRGIGSLYYLSFATGKATFSDVDALWSTVAFTVVLSIFVHGVTATPVMRALDRRRTQRDQRRSPSVATAPLGPSAPPGRDLRP